MLRKLVPVVVLLVCAGAACHDTVEPSRDVVATLRIRPGMLSLAADGGQASVVVEGESQDGAYLQPAPRILLYVRDTTIAAVEAPMLVTGRKAGTTYLIAQSADGPAFARDSISIHVGQFTESP